MKVTVVVDGNRMVLPDSSSTTITSFIPNTPQGSTNVDGSVHYYMYVESEDIHWNTAYNNARSYYFMGMRGYLVTITQLEEDKILDKITSYGAWAGGLRLSETFASENYDSANATAYTKPSTTAGSHWVWCNGPEKGVEINNSGSTDSTGKDKTHSVKAVSTGYSNWRRVPGDSSNQEPNNYSDSEWCMQVHYPGDKTAQQAANGAEQGWNDLAVGSNQYVKIMGYFVEFSNYPGGLA